MVSSLPWDVSGKNHGRKNDHHLKSGNAELRLRSAQGMGPRNHPALIIHPSVSPTTGWMNVGWLYQLYPHLLHIIPYHHPIIIPSTETWMNMLESVPKLNSHILMAPSIIKPCRSLLILGAHETRAFSYAPPFFPANVPNQSNESPPQVAIRTLALEREELIAQGRKVVCPDQRLVCDPVPLALARRFFKNGRSSWEGFCH